MSDALYRIIDANFNRGREALRVMEEYCRFGLNNPALSGRAKQSRHLLCESMKGIDPLIRLTHRDVGGDVGKELKVAGQLKRQSVEDCFAAASNRASEALRALAESIQPIDPSVAAIMEKIRFDVYALEKDAVLSSCTKGKFQPVKLYVLINATNQTTEHSVLDLANKCVENGADCIQMRAKQLPDSLLLDLALKFTDLCRRNGVISIINDRTDIAVLSGADGVHLGQDEIPVSYARQLARKPLIVGVSTHNDRELKEAIDSNCDYVGIGPAFPSPTKPHLDISGLDYIKQAIPALNEAGIFHVAIGGINQQNIPSLLEIGTRAVAVSSAITQSEFPDKSCRLLKKLMSNES